MRQGLNMGGRALGTYVMALVLALLAGLGISSDLYWLQISINVFLLAGMCLMLLSDGGVRGERACTTTATIARMEKEGKTPDETTRAGRFERKNALIGYIAAALPLLLLACANLVAEPFYPPVIIEETQIDLDMSVESEEEAQAYLQAHEPPEEETPVNWINVAARVGFSPVMASYWAFRQNPHGLNLLFLAFSLIWPLPQTIGYLRGPALREKKLRDIEKGKKKKMRNLRVNKKPRTPKPPKMEV